MSRDTSTTDRTDLEQIADDLQKLEPIDDEDLPDGYNNSLPPHMVFVDLDTVTIFADRDGDLWVATDDESRCVALGIMRDLLEDLEAVREADLDRR